MKIHDCNNYIKHNSDYRYSYRLFLLIKQSNLNDIKLYICNVNKTDK